MARKYELRFAYLDEWQDIMQLAWKTFLQFEAKDYSEEGIQNFNNFVTDHTLYKMFVSGVYQVVIALEDKKIVGMISLRDVTHISLLFVDAQYHKKGIGRALVVYMGEHLKNEEGYSRMTVNAAPYALGFYHKLGFVDLDTEKENDGIRYTPMELKIGSL